MQKPKPNIYRGMALAKALAKTKHQGHGKNIHSRRRAQRGGGYFPFSNHEIWF